ncbi:uncharacterized protein LOC143201307 isoform X2 [Rhynchophorus ferrugineus]|uniref:Uncharacterized protein n=1 Tax=Rhynchophorus ferrugineus TaxID=354439 RepID=A0A834IN47_RHYFE|nr:hypothetical protein GWI33_005393 [Rhynchophorus ferrugineus]
MEGEKTPSLEESFVILGDSLVPSLEDQYGKSLAQETKQLINEELQNLCIKGSNMKPSINISQNASTSNESQPLSQNEVSNKTSFYGTLPKLPNGLEVKDTQSITSFLNSTDMNSEEFQISQLVEENVQLKNTIIQNNNSMKAQYAKIREWQKEVEEIHENHKQKFIKAKQFIETLKNDNVALKQEISRLSCAPKSESNEKIKTYVEENMNKAELDLAKKKIASLEVELQEKNEACVAERSKRVQYEQKLEKFEMELENCYKTIREQKKQLEDALKQIQENVDAKEALQQHIEKNNKLEQNLLETTMDKKALSESISALTHKLDEKNGLVQYYQEQVMKLQSEVQNNQHVCEAEALKQQLMVSQKALTDCQQFNSNYQNKVAQLTAKNLELEEKLAQYSTYDDTIYALKTQIEINKNDFETEKRAKDDAIRERQQMGADLQNIHRRNTQLLEEIEYYRDRLSNMGEPPLPRAPPREEAPGPILRCPKCCFQFGTYTALENHVHRCLDVDGFP